MFKKLTVAVLVVSMALTSSIAFAGDDNKKVDLSIESMIDRPLDKPEEGMIKVADLHKGVFVTAVGGWSSVYPNTAQLVKDRLREKGIKVVEKPEDADVGLQFYGNPFDLEEVDTNVKSGINKVNLGIDALLAISNPAMLFSINLLNGSDGDKVKTMIQVRIADKPTVSGRGKMNGEGERNLFIISDLIYHTKHADATTSTLVFNAYVDQFIKDHFVFDHPDSVAAKETASPAVVSDVVPASAVALPDLEGKESSSTSATIAENKH